MKDQDADRSGDCNLLHLSDLHLGRTASDEIRTRSFVARAVAENVDHVVVTGDVTNRGRHEEVRMFHTLFQPLADAGRLTVVPGNHDRNGDDIASQLQQGPRVQVRTVQGLHLVRFDSTGPHNRSWFAGHGSMSLYDIEHISEALDQAPPAHLVVLLLHHHPLPLPEDNKAELLTSLLGWRWTSELELGWTLLRRLAGRCDLVLHGHRHQPRAFRLFEEQPRPLALFNAGSSTELGAARVFRHQQGQLVAPPTWWRDLSSINAKLSPRKRQPSVQELLPA